MHTTLLQPSLFDNKVAVRASRPMICYASSPRLKVLNLYAGIGGNRKLWENCDVTAVEYNKEIADVYADLFPADEVIVGDAHQFLLDNYRKYDFIWSSPPCPTHSRARFWGDAHFDYEKKYPDMSLYQQIIFLTHFAKNKWVVENVIPYYQPLLPAKKIGRHLIWSNFHIADASKQGKFEKDKIESLQKYLDINLSAYKVKNKIKLLRNCTHPEFGAHIYTEMTRGQHADA
jgi:DNA (cytosine-5)-methyltransferase 1